MAREFLTDERVERSLVQLCEKTFNFKPYKIEALGDKKYKLIFCDPDEETTFFAESVTFKYDGKELKFATSEDEERWTSCRHLYSILK